MTEYDIAQQEHTLREWGRILHWNASIHGWIGKTDDFSIFVPEEVYKRSVRAYLASQGIEWKTYLEIMRPAVRLLLEIYNAKQFRPVKVFGL